jgi:hypothetical protein
MPTPMHHLRFSTPLLAMLLLAGTLLTSCGGNKFCNCLKEEEKEIPDQAVLDKCREAFAKMEMDEIKEAIDNCGK